MVLLRGLLGRRASYLPTVLNLVQCVGWATFEIVIIAEAASRVLDAPRWPFVLGGGRAGHADGAAAARRRSGCSRGTRVWAALAARRVPVRARCCRTRCRRSPTAAPARSGPPPTSSSRCRSRGSRWPPTTPGTSATAGRPSPARRSATALATVAFFTLGVLALAAYGAAGLDVIDALLAVPLGAVAVLVLVVVEVDEAFANIYSTAVSAQNVAARLDRRVLAVIVGAARHAARAHLRHRRLRAVPVPHRRGVRAAGRRVRGRLLLVPRGAPGTRPATAPARPLLLLPWVAGFVAYQLTLPTFFAGTGARAGRRGGPPARPTSASTRPTAGPPRW